MCYVYAIVNDSGIFGNSLKDKINNYIKKVMLDEVIRCMVIRFDDNSLNNIEYNDEEKIETVSFTKEEAVENDNNKKNNNNKHKNKYHKHHKPTQGNKNGKGENRSN